MTARDVDIDIDLEVDVDDLLAADALIDSFVAKVKQMDDEIKIDIDVDDLVSAQTNLSLLHEQISHLDGKTIDINVDVDTGAAHAQLTALSAHSLSAGKNPSVSPLGGFKPVTGGMSALASSSITKIAGIVGILILSLPILAGLLQGLVGVFAILGVAIGVVAGGLFSFVSALGVAAIGIVGFAAVGITTITALYEKNAKLNAQQIALKKHTDSVVESWGDLKTSMQSVTYGAIESGVKIVNQLLDRSEPILRNATIAMDGLFGSMEKSFAGQNMTNFFSYLERAVGPLTGNIGRGLGSMLEGLFNWMVALEPLTAWVGQGFENMMNRFSDWTASLQGSERMTAFMEYVKTNMPVIGDIFANGRDGIINWFAAFDSTAADGLGFMADKMEEFATWSGSLDENESFQAFLETLKTDGPIVAEILGNMSSNIVDMVNALSDTGLLESVAKLTDSLDAEKIANNLSFKSLLKPTWLTSLEAFGFSFSDFAGRNLPKQEVQVEVTANTTKANAEIEALVSNSTPKELPLTPRLNTLNMPQLPTLDAEVQATTVKVAEVSPKVPVTAQVEKVESLAPLKLNAENITKKATEFSWPPLPKFEWPKLPTWIWPTLPVFRWPAMPKFSWPPMPRVSVNVNGLPGFSSGLGRVNAPEMPAVVHQNEAILQDHNAQFLRDIGALQGDGRNPVINKEALSAYGTPQTTTTYAVQQKQSGAGTQIDVGGIQVIVQGGNTNTETGSAVKAAIEEVFASLGEIMPLGLEG